MGYWIASDGSYHEGDKQSGDIDVPPRPSVDSAWDFQNSIWIAVDPDIRRSLAAGIIDVDAFIRTVVTVLFDQENRIRTLEARATVTKPQYVTALKNIYKGFIP